MPRYAEVDAQTNRVRNVSEWDGREYDPETAPDAWRVPEGVTVIPAPTASPGDIYDPATGTFTRPEPAPDAPPSPVTKRQTLVSELEAASTLAGLKAALLKFYGE